MTNAERAQVLVDGAPLPDASSTITFSEPNIAGLVAVDGNIYVTGLAAGETELTVQKAGRSGSVLVTVTEAPLIVTLGTPEPK
jgi:Flp pilus assembly secretin CpaC